MPRANGPERAFQPAARRRYWGCRTNVASGIISIMEREPTVFVVDDDPNVRESLAQLLGSVGQPCKMFATAKEFLEDYDPASPGCGVLDVRLPGMSGNELHRHLEAEGISLPVIIISGHGDISMATAAIRRGAVDFMEKPVKPQQLLDRIQWALEQDSERRRAKADRDAIAARFALLTPREREVVHLVVTGLTNKQIAFQFGVSPQAIDVQRAKAMKKMGADNVVELVKLMLAVKADQTLASGQTHQFRHW